MIEKPLGKLIVDGCGNYEVLWPGEEERFKRDRLQTEAICGVHVTPEEMEAVDSLSLMSPMNEEKLAHSSALIGRLQEWTDALPIGREKDALWIAALSMRCLQAPKLNRFV